MKEQLKTVLAPWANTFGCGNSGMASGKKCLAVIADCRTRLGIPCHLPAPIWRRQPIWEMCTNHCLPPNTLSDLIGKHHAAGQEAD